MGSGPRRSHRRPDVAVHVENVDRAVLEQPLAPRGVEVLTRVQAYKRGLLRHTGEPLEVVPQAGVFEPVDAQPRPRYAWARRIASFGDHASFASTISTAPGPTARLSPRAALAPIAGPGSRPSA